MSAPEPPVTADHTPERILTAHLAALRAECDALREQKARVEAVLAEPDDVQQWEDDTHECPDFLEVPIVTVARVRAALHPDPSEAARDE